MFISIVIPTYNNRETIKACLDSLKKLRYPEHEVVIIDDGSTDGTVETIEEFQPKFNIRLFEYKSLGVSAARNKGVEKAKGDLILFTDPDCLFKGGLLTEISNYFSKNEKVDILAGTKETWNRENDLARFIHYLRQPLIEKIKKEDLNYTGTHLLVCRRKVFGKVKFNEKFKKPSVEDLEFGNRAKEFFDIEFNEDLSIYHVDPEDPWNYFKKLSYKNSGFFLKFLDRVKDKIKTGFKGTTLSDIKRTIDEIKWLLLFLVCIISVLVNPWLPLILALAGIFISNLKVLKLAIRNNERVLFCLKTFFYDSVIHGAEVVGVFLGLLRLISFVKFQK